MVIYNLNANTLTKIATFDKLFFQRDAIFISDIAYNPGQSQIFISDNKFGINVIQIDTSKEGFDPYLLTNGYRKVGCNVIVYVDGDLYASCDDLFKVRYDSDQ